MALTVQSILDRVTDLLTDKDRADEEARWPDAELLRWINDARTAIAVRKPSACAKVAPLTLVAGALQALPAEATVLLDVICNLGSDGVTPGRAIRRTDRQLIDDEDPEWQGGTQASVITQFTYDDRTPKAFHVYPPAVDGTYVRASYAYLAAEVTSTSGAGSTLDIDAEHIEAVANYVCFRSKSKDSEYANAGEAQAYYSAFMDALGLSAQAASAASPNQPGNSV